MPLKGRENRQAGWHYSLQWPQIYLQTPCGSIGAQLSPKSLGPHQLVCKEPGKEREHSFQKQWQWQQQGCGNFCVQSLKLAAMSREVFLDGASGSFPPCIFSDFREPGHLGVRPSSSSFFADLFGSRGRMRVGQTVLLHPDQSSKDR